MHREYIDLCQNISGGDRRIRHRDCDDGASGCIADNDQGVFIETGSRPGVPGSLMADMPTLFMRSSSVHDTRSLVKLLITVEGRSENSDDVPKGNPLTAVVNAAHISSAALILYWPWAAPPQNPDTTYVCVVDWPQHAISLGATPTGRGQ